VRPFGRAPGGPLKMRGAPQGASEVGRRDPAACATGYALSSFQDFFPGRPSSGGSRRRLCAVVPQGLTTAAASAIPWKQAVRRSSLVACPAGAAVRRSSLVACPAGAAVRRFLLVACPAKSPTTQEFRRLPAQQAAPQCPYGHTTNTPFDHSGRERGGETAQAEAPTGFRPGLFCLPPTGRAYSPLGTAENSPGRKPLQLPTSSTPAALCGRWISLDELPPGRGRPGPCRLVRQVNKFACPSSPIASRQTSSPAG